jgi:VanZ family protein
VGNGQMRAPFVPNPHSVTIQTQAPTTPASRHSRLLLIVWLLSLAVVVVCSIASAQSSVIRLIAATHLSDLFEHFAAYAFLAALPVFGRFGFRAPAMAALLFLLGVMLELAQRLSPGRSFDWLDIAANSAGILVGVGLALCFRRPAYSQKCT